jgi:hypothetical protein
VADAERAAASLEIAVRACRASSLQELETALAAMAATASSRRKSSGIGVAPARQNLAGGGAARTW